MIAEALEAVVRLTAGEVSDPCAEERRALRTLTRSQSWVPVRVVDGDGAPERLGAGCRYETRTGKAIDHPSAYSKKGWSSMVYVPSSVRIEVGRGWLFAWRLEGGVYSVPTET